MVKNALSHSDSKNIKSPISQEKVGESTLYQACIYIYIQETQELISKLLIRRGQKYSQPVRF